MANWARSRHDGRPSWHGAISTPWIRAVFIVLSSAWIMELPRADAQSTLPFTPTTDYERRTIEGWTILINKEFLARQAELADQTLALLTDQLHQIAQRLPSEPLKKLRSVRIWVEETSHNPGMTYHPDAEWLREHGLNPDKARCVELANARNFLKWSKDQPWMVLHELSHAYHDQFIEGGFQNPEIKAAFQHAREARLYDSVLKADGKQGRAYAAENPKEYFAESSEAFFGTNDQYPFVREELRQYDPHMADLLQNLWAISGSEAP